MRALIVVAVVVGGALGYGGALWLRDAEPPARRGPDGTLDLSAPAPRIHGRPDLSGMWEAERTPTSEFVRVLGPGLPEIQPDLNDITKHMLNVFWDENPADVPLRPEAAAIAEQRQKSGRDFPSAYCLPSGLPAATLTLHVKMIQGRDEIIVLHGNGDPARQIHLDGRTLPATPDPSWMGTSVGRWEDDGTLVVETTGFQERAWLDGFGHPRSESMRITERFRRRDVGHMDLEMTFDDPKYYTRPFGFKTTLTLLPDSHLLEYVCMENQKFKDYVPK